MESRRRSSSVEVEVGQEQDVDLSWFFGLRDTVLSCFTQSRIEMEMGKSDNNNDNPVPWAITSALAVLSSDEKLSCKNSLADIPRKALIEYFVNTNGARILLELLEYTTSYKVGEKTTKILRELVSVRSGKQRTAIVKQCLDANYLAVSVSVLRQLVKGTASKSSSKAVTTSTTPASTTPATVSLEDCSVSGSSGMRKGGSISSHATIATICSSYNDLGNGTATTADFIWFLAGVTAKDSHFPDKVRQMLKVKFFHDVFKKLFFSKSNLHFPLLKILRQLSKCRRVANILGKDKVMHTAKRAFTVVNQQPNQKMLMLMESLAMLTREKRNSVRFLKAGLLVKVLGFFRHWAHWKGKGLLKLSKSVINIYTHLARTKSGKPALKNSEAISLIRSFCEQCPQEKAFDDVIMKTCAMIHICYEKENIPLEGLECPIKFEVPSPSDGYPDDSLVLVDSGSSSDEDDPDDGEDNEDEDSFESENEDDGNSDNDDLCDNDDDELVEGEMPQKLPSRRNSRLHTAGDPEINERIELDKMARFSYYFRELSPNYCEQNENEPDSLLLKMEKLEESMSHCILEDSPEDSDATNDSNENILVSTRGGRSSLPRLPQSTFPIAVHKYSWTSRHGARLPKMEGLRRLYFKLANKIYHVSPFVKLAYPDICFGLSGKQVESLCASADRVLIRRKIYAAIAHAICEHPGFRPRIVYSLDELIEIEQSSSNADSSSSKTHKSGKLLLGNTDENEVGRYDPKSPLYFESRFESGNLRKAIQIGEHEYDLFLTSDINSSRHNQWFYFQVGNVCDDTHYTFNIVNCIKTNSLFNYGMQPVVFSVMDAIKQKPGWVRSGTGICYYRNGYKCIGKKSVKTYHTLSFTLTFQNKGDIVYIAYYIPYTYTRLMVEIHNLLSTVKHSDKVHCRYDVLCKSLDGNDIPLITITGPPPSKHNEDSDIIRIADRDVIFITSRVHPGETNASWVMMGILRKLMLGNHVEELLNRFVFKIVPMLNVEGVVNGCHRSGLTSQDLNRCWKNPNETLHPSIYGTKMLVAYSCKIRGKQPMLFLDLHGHSRRKNAFFYGCSYARSWRQEDRITPENPQKLYALAESMSVHCPYFVMHFCHYDVRKSRESTARVAIWREFGIPCSFTLECSYCGCDRGQFKGITFGSGQLWEIGEGLCEAIQTMDLKMQSLAQQQKLNIYEEPVAVIESFKGNQ